MNKPARHDGYILSKYERLKILIPIMKCKLLKGLVPMSLKKNERSRPIIIIIILIYIETPSRSGGSEKNKMFAHYHATIIITQNERAINMERSRIRPYVPTC